jgi:TatA/E family protein of Tat protein translocase
MSFGIQPIHIIFIVIVALLVFGPRRLPEIGRNIGKALNEIRRMTNGITDILDQEVKQADKRHANSNSISVNTVLPTPLTSDTIETPPSPENIMADACINCGATIIQGARFCNNCGSRLPEKSG